MSSSARAALVGEFDMLRRTRHPNLLHGEDAFDVEDGPFAGCVVFVLELADTDLASELGRRGPLPPAELAVVGAHVASGLAALHAGGHLHGDVKPANLLRVGSTWKLGDFGVSSAVQGSYSVAPGATLDYTPPELSAGPDGYRVHRSADVWALGVTLWKAATGQHPFAGATPYTRLAAALRGDRAPAAIDPDLAELINCCCLVADPRSRLAAAELAVRMDALAVRLGGRPARSAVADHLFPTWLTKRMTADRPTAPDRPAQTDGPGGASNPKPEGRSEAVGPPPARAAHPGPLGPLGTAPGGPAGHPGVAHPGPTAQPGRTAHPQAAAVPGPSGNPAGPGWPPASPAPQPNGAQPPGPAARRSWAERWRRIRIGLCAALAVLTTAGIVQVTSLAAAALPFGLTVRRTVYLVLAVAALAGIGWVLRRSGSPTARWSAAAGALLTLLAGTEWLFWGV